MNIEYDQQADAIYIRLKDEPVATTREVEDHLIVDLGASGKLVGIELLFVSDYLAPEDIATFSVTNLRAAG